MIVTISGLVGSRSDVIARYLALKLGFRSSSTDTIIKRLAEEEGISEKEFFERMVREKEVMERVIEEEEKVAAKGRVVMDTLLLPFFSTKVDVRVFLRVSDKERARRLAKEYGIPLAEALEIIREVDESLKKALFRWYGIDVETRDVYDLVMNTELMTPEGASEVILKYMEKRVRV